ncbi:MAG: murein L,D-transpeptidase catalytic domain family protein [Chlorobiaceae bacterium]|nr:murein L,D-transpeptidase catalytic domain family protein [Chlorobiaceae bacterium]
MEKQVSCKWLAVKIFGTAFLALVLLFAGSSLFQPPEKISPEAYRAAYAALGRYRAQHPGEQPLTIAIVDFSKPSYVERMAVVDLTNGSETFYRVAHGKKSGQLYSRIFSNIPQSNMSSLGLYKVLDAYYGDHGKAMRLEGLEPALNDSVFVRDIVLHSASYVSQGYILLNLMTFNGPMIGRSNGCFVVSPSEIEEIVAKFSRGAFIYAWADTSGTKGYR